MAQNLVDEITLLKKKLATKQKKLAKYERVVKAKAHVKQKLKEQAFLESVSKPLLSQYEFKINRKCSVKPNISKFKIHEKIDGSVEHLCKYQFREKEIRDASNNPSLDAKYDISKAAEKSNAKFIESLEVFDSQHSKNVDEMSTCETDLLTNKNCTVKSASNQKLSEVGHMVTSVDHRTVLSEVSHGCRLSPEELSESNSVTTFSIPSQTKTLNDDIISEDCLQVNEEKIRTFKDQRNLSPFFETAKDLNCDEVHETDTADVFNQTEKQTDSTTNSDTSFSKYTLDSDSESQTLPHDCGLSESENFSKKKSCAEKVNTDQEIVKLSGSKFECGTSHTNSRESVDQQVVLQSENIENEDCRQIKTKDCSKVLHRHDRNIKVDSCLARDEKISETKITSLISPLEEIKTKNVVSKSKMLSLKRKRKYSERIDHPSYADKSTTYISGSDTISSSAESSFPSIEQNGEMRVDQMTPHCSKSDAVSLHTQSEESSTCDSEPLFTDQDFEILKFHYCQELKETSNDEKGGALGRGRGRGRRRSSGPIRHSPRIASSSSQESESSQCGSINRTCVPKRGRFCQSSILLSSIFQFLIDETKREKNEKEFSLPLNQFQHLSVDSTKKDVIVDIKYPLEECDNNDQITVEYDKQQDLKVESNNLSFDSCTHTFVESETNGKSVSHIHVNVCDKSNQSISDSKRQFQGRLDCDSLADDQSRCRRWEYTQTLPIFPGTSLEGLAVSVSKIDEQEVDIVVCFSGSTVYVWLSTWEQLGIWTAQNDMMILDVYLPVVYGHIAVVVIAHAEGQITVQLLIYFHPKNVQVHEVAVMRSKRIICCIMDRNDFVLGFYNNSDDSSILTKYRINEPTEELTKVEFDRIEQELTTFKCTAEKSMVLGLTVSYFLHIWNSENGLLLTSINLSSFLCQNLFMVTGFYEQGLLFLPILDKNVSSSPSANGVLVINPQSTAIKMLHIYSTDVDWKGCRSADVADDILVMQDKMGHLHFYDVFSGEYGGSYDQQCHVFAICHKRLYLGCEEGLVHVFTLK